MTKFLDGPAVGVSLSLSRAPLFLRAVYFTGWDALDQLDDEVAEHESVYAYEKVADHGGVFLDGRDRKTGKRWGRHEQSADYKVVACQPLAETMRDNAKWAEWCQAEFESRKEPAR